MNETILEVKHLCKRYGQEEVLHDISFSLEHGKIYALAGPSGCGKTTLLHCLGTLEPFDGGLVRFNGKTFDDIRSLPRFRRESIGFVFQFHYLLESLTLYENILLAMAFSSLSEAEKNARVAELLASVGLAGKSASFPDRISGGERQRAAIARAFANAPQLIFADEPTGNVDSRTTKLILEKMQTYVGKNGTTMLIATHDPLVVDIADEVLLMQDGRIKGMQ